MTKTIKIIVTVLVSIVLFTYFLLFNIFATENIKQQELPSVYRGVLKTNTTKLKSVWGYPMIAPRSPEDYDCLYCVTALAYSPNGKMVLSAHKTHGEGYYTSGEMKLWDTTNGEVQKTFMGHSRVINSVDYSSDGLTVVSASTDGTIRLWDINTLKTKVLKKVHAEHDIAWAVATVPFNKKVLIATTETPSLKLLDMDSGKEIQTYDTEWNINKITVSNNGKIALTVSRNELPTLWDVNSGKLIKKFKRQGKILAYLFSTAGTWSSGCLSKDGRTIVAGSTDGMIRLWDVVSGKEVWAEMAHKDGVNDVTFIDNGAVILSVGYDSTVKIWNSTNGKLIDLIDLAGSNDIGMVLSSSPDSQSFVVGTLRGVILNFQFNEK